MKRTTRRSLLILLIVLVNSLLFADIRTTGEISGNIQTEDGQPLPGASVALASENLIQRSVVEYSNDQGFFRFLNLKPGKYIATVTLQGFATKKYEIDVEVGSVKSIKAVLTPSTVSEEVEVTDIVPLIDAKSPQIAVNYNRETVERIPIRREFIEFMDLVPGVNDRGAYGAGGQDERN